MAQTTTTFLGGESQEIKGLDTTGIFFARFISWTVRARTYGTAIPLISYRGHLNSKWKLLPSLCRGSVPVPYLKQNEEELIKEFRGRFNLKDWKSIEVLSYARHCGAPTRLLDWSRNPLAALWFAVSDHIYDKLDGAIHQLCLLNESSNICLNVEFELEHADNCKGGKLVHLFPGPSRIDRTERQRSVFSITTFNDDSVLKPLDQLHPSTENPILSTFRIPANLKKEIRFALGNFGLDAFSIYGDADSYGQSLAAAFHDMKSYLPGAF